MLFPRSWSKMANDHLMSWELPSHGEERCLCISLDRVRLHLMSRSLGRSLASIIYIRFHDCHHRTSKSHKKQSRTRHVHSSVWMIASSNRLRKAWEYVQRRTNCELINSNCQPVVAKETCLVCEQSVRRRKYPQRLAITNRWNVCVCVCIYISTGNNRTLIKPPRTTTGVSRCSFK